MTTPAKPRRLSLPLWVVIVGLIGLVVLLVVIKSVTVVSAIKAEALNAKTHGTAALNAIKSQDLPTAKVELEVTHRALTATQSRFKKLSFWNVTPLRQYYQDGLHALNAGLAGVEAGQHVVNAIDPYADVLGLKGKGTFAGGTAEDRLVKLVGTLTGMTPAFDTVQQKLAYMDDEMNQINPSRYPFKVGGQSVGALITQAKNSLKDADEMMTQLKPAIQVLPDILGATGERKYLIIFQNDAEIRPTGGFITAYSVVTVNSGKITPVKSDDIYSLDAKFTQSVKAPEAITKYLIADPKWRLRDMNLSPDFKVSMDTFMRYYQTVPGADRVDGVIALDTQVFKDLLQVLGPVEVPGYGVFSPENDPRCNCPQAIYQLEDMTSRPVNYVKNDRKAVLGPLMQNVLFKAYGSGSETWPALFKVAWSNLTQKHILFYFSDERHQTAAETNNFAGRLTAASADYLHISDTNFGGAKSNLFVTQEVTQDIKAANGQAEETVTVVYKNPARGSNCNLEAGKLCLNGVLGNWVRFYLPKNAKLTNSSGLQAGSVKESEDLDKHVVEGFFKLNPESQATISVSYTVPVPAAGDYKLLLQSQAGDKGVPYTVKFNGQQQKFDLVTDKEVVFKI